MGNPHLKIKKKNKTKTNKPKPGKKKPTSFLTTACFLQAKLLKTKMNKKARRLTSETYLISYSSEILNNGKRREEAK